MMTLKPHSIIFYCVVFSRKKIKQLKRFHRHSRILQNRDYTENIKRIIEEPVKKEQDKIEQVMHEFKTGELKSGKDV
jgi:hypothetical protein